MGSCAAPGRGGADHVQSVEKSVFGGELLAIFPGVLVHGTGHRYAGNTERANELLTMEGYSLLTAGLGAGIYALGVSEDAEAVEITGWIGIGAGSLAFLGTWIYDLVFTPAEIDRYNRKVRAAR